MNDLLGEPISFERADQTGITYLTRDSADQPAIHRVVNNLEDDP